MKDNIIKIGISGKMRSGKGTAANAIKARLEEFEYRPKILSLATPLKELVKKGLGREDREALQVFGTDIVRKGCATFFGTEKIWVNFLISTANSLRESAIADCFICDDVRFVDEAQTLKEDGWVLVRIMVPEDVQLARPQDPAKGDIKAEALSHESEIALDGRDDLFDIIVDGNKDIEALRVTMESIVDAIIEKTNGKLPTKAIDPNWKKHWPKESHTS